MHGPNTRENADTGAEAANTAQEKVHRNLTAEEYQERRRVHQVMQSH